MIIGTNIIIGVLLAVLAAAIGTTSKQLIAASEHLKKPWMFHLGAGMNIAFGPVVDASAYGFAPQVIVAPFACLDVIFNAITAPYTLHWQQERLTRRHLIGTGFVALGAILTSVFAAADNLIYSVEELEAQLFLRPTSICYMLVELTLIIAANMSLKRRLLNASVRGICLGVVAGVLMGNVFFIKGLIGIIQTTAHTGDWGAWLRPTPYILAAAAGGGAVTGHIFMRKGLGEYKGVFMVTIFEGAHISAACLSGCIVMEEMAGAPWWRYMLYWCSVSLIVVGLVVMNMAAADAQIEGKFHIAQADGFREDSPEDDGIGTPRIKVTKNIPEDQVPIQNADEVAHSSGGESRPGIGRPFEEMMDVCDIAAAGGDHVVASPELSSRELRNLTVENGAHAERAVPNLDRSYSAPASNSSFGNDLVPLEPP